MAGTFTNKQKRLSVLWRNVDRSRMGGNRCTLYKKVYSQRHCRKVRVLAVQIEHAQWVSQSIEAHIHISVLPCMLGKRSVRWLVISVAKKRKKTNKRKKQTKSKQKTDLVRKIKKALFKRSFAKLVVSPIYVLIKMVTSRFLAEKKNISNEH